MTESYETILASLLGDLDRVLGTRYSAVLYGSAARGDWVPGVSDINILLVVDDTSPAVLRTLTQPFSAWRRRGNPPPMLFRRDEWSRAADAFPIELMDIQHAHRVLRGTDPVAGLMLATPHLRLLLEHELRGKLLQLRRGYVALSEDRAALSQLGLASMPTILILLRGTLTLAGKPVPREPEALIRETSVLTGADASALLEIMRHRPEHAWIATREQFEAYLSAVEAAARYVDHLQLGAGS
jgi:hypothetical protein